MRGVRMGWAVLAALGLTACQDLPDVQGDFCGNGVVEPTAGEDCDQKDATTPKSACGQPGKANACRWICDRSTDLACPDGWRCGVGGVCSKPTSPQTWNNSFLEVPGAGADTLLPADLDGDGVTDVVSVADPLVDVTYFEQTTGSATPGDELIAPGAHPALDALLPGDLPTLLLPLSRGLATYAATDDRGLSPATYAAVSISSAGMRVQPFTLDDPKWPGLPLRPTAFLAYTSGGLAAVTDVQMGNELLVFGPLGEAVGDGVVARYDEYLKCEQMAIALDRVDGSHVGVFSPCDPNGNVKLTLTADIKLPGTLHVCKDCQPIHRVDIDGNGKPDLVVIGEDHQAYFAYGNGQGGFSSNTQVAPDYKVSNAYPIPGPPQAMPLAVADLNKDCALDFVLRMGLYVSTGVIPQQCSGGAQSIAVDKYYSPSTQEDPHDWTEARVADLNHDGFLDVVAASSKQLGISGYFGNGTPLPNPFEIPTSGSTRALAVGDFDGDLLDDIVFAETGKADPETMLVSDTVYVSFGAATGTPSAAAAVGQVGVVTQILPAFEPVTASDLITDIFVVADTPMVQDKSDIFLFPGNSSRQINAPYYLVDLSLANQTLDVPRRALVGRFTTDTAYRDIAIFGRSTNGNADLWLLPTDKDAAIVPVSAGTGRRPLSTPLPAALASASDVLLANLGPRKGGEVDEILIVAPGAFGTSPMGMPSSTSTLLSTATAGDGAFATPSDPQEIAGFAITDGPVISGQVIAAHVRGPDQLDVVLASPQDGLALVPWDPATATLDVSGAVHITKAQLDDAMCGAIKPGPASAAVAALTADDDGRQALLLVRAGLGYHIGWDGSGPTIECFFQLDGGRAVATGDFDGDGVEDILVGQRTGFTVYFGDAEAPGGGSGGTVSTEAQ